LESCTAMKPYRERSFSYTAAFAWARADNP
jgi:hypothetical protein